MLSCSFDLDGGVELSSAFRFFGVAGMVEGIASADITRAGGRTMDGDGEVVTSVTVVVAGDIAWCVGDGISEIGVGM